MGDTNEAMENNSGGVPPSPYQRQDVGDPIPLNNANNGGGYDEEPEANYVDSSLSLHEVLYSCNSYHAIAKPVSLTMILSALAVVFVNTEESLSAGRQEMASYTVFKMDDNEPVSTGQAVEYSLLNALVIVSVICAMTFGIVLLYKFRCMKFLIGYMMFSSSTLLGFLGGTLFYYAVQKYRIPIDYVTFLFVLYNFAIVGTTSIFFQSGIPTYITQGYLVATSVILAWQLSHFDAWTTWALLIMLAMYDLCAVLTPCGPLRALVNLMQEDDSPEMPGLLYEAQLPEGTRRPGNNQQQQQQSQRVPGRSDSGAADTAGGRGSSSRGNGVDAAAVEEGTAAASANPSSGFDPQQLQRSFTDGSQATVGNTSSRAGEGGVDSISRTNSAPFPPSSSAPTGAGRGENGSVELSRAGNAAPDDGDGDARPGGRGPTGHVPLAIARLYRLPLVSPPPATETDSCSRSSSPVDGSSTPSTSPLLEEEQREERQRRLSQRQQQLSPAELRAEVEVVFPRNGGRIVKSPASPDSSSSSPSGGDGPRYHVLGRRGEVKRVLVVDRRGRVFQETEEEYDEYEDDDGKPASIRLGLGDFIFYSVLVSKAAMYSFATFVACMLVILAGLGGTLVLLSVYHKALPALPISIFLGVVFYLLTRALIEPWVQDVLTVPYYV